jgi:cytochrome c-type biogenesis protein CcmF
MMQEKRGMMKVWNVWLIFITFMLCILGTLLTRAGLVSSVHAFAQSSIGSWFVTFLIIILGVCLIVFITNRDHLASENKLESLVSRESSFLFNNVVLLAVTFAILSGTLFPILSEAVRGYKIAVGAPFFNKVTIPMGLILIFLTAVGPLLAWGSTSYSSVKRNFFAPTIASGIMACFLIGLKLISVGYRFFSSFTSLDLSHYFSAMALVLSTLVIATVLSEFVRGGRVLREKLNTNLLSGMYHLARRNMRRYGGYVAHIGFAVVVIGLAGLAFNQEQEQELSAGETMKIGHYSLVSQGSTQDDLPNYRSDATMLDVYKDGTFLTRLNPAVFVYKPMEQPDHKVAIHHGPFEDLYVIYAGGNPERPTIKAFVNPLVSFVWLGVIILLFGTGLALVPNAVKATVPAAVTVVAGGERTDWQPAGVRE